MHYSFLPDLRDLRAGDVFAVKSADWPSRKRALLTVVSAKPYSPVEAKDREGRTYVALYGEQKLVREDGFKWAPLWTLPMPKLDDEDLLRFIDIMTGLEGNDAPAMFHIRETGPEFAAAKLVFTLVGDKDEDMIREGAAPYTWTRNGTARVMDQDVLIPNGSLPEGCAALDLVLAERLDCDYKDGKLLTDVARRRSSLRLPEILARAVRLERLQDFLPFREHDETDSGRLTGFGYHGTAMKLADHLDFENEADNALARTEPDEALVLWYPSDFREGRTECQVISHTGYVFHITDAPEDQFYGTVIEPGLWVFHGANFWSYTSHEGEHDWGIEGGWRPAEPGDAERFGFTEASLTDEVACILDDIGINEPRDGLCAKWMAMAEAAAAGEKAESQANMLTATENTEDLNPSGNAVLTGVVSG